MSVPTELLAAISTVADACRVARSVQQHLAHVREITKDDRSPVTVADFAVQAIVSMAMREHDPSVLIVGEEKADALRQDDHAAIRNEVVEAVRVVHPHVSGGDVLDAIDRCDHDATGDSYWALDPIDGTKGFLRGQQYAIALGLIEQGKVVAGVMGCPNLPADQSASLTDADPRGVMYTASRGNGAWQINPDQPTDDATRIRARTEVSPQGIQTCESVEASHSKHNDTACILDLLGGAGNPARLDSQCKYAVVARGQADAYLRLPTRKDYVERIWDHAAGSIIATESGAMVSDITGSTLDFSRGCGLESNRGIICASASLHGRIITAIEQLGLAATV